MKKLLRAITVLAILSVTTLGIYYFFRIYFFAVHSYHLADGILALLLFLAESFMIIHALGFSVSILRLGKKKKLYRFKKLNLRKLPAVAVVIPARHEPQAVLEQTFITCQNLDYKNKNIYLLDGSTDAKFLKQDRALCSQYGISFFHPKKLHGAKAGIINEFVKNMREDYVAIFDADQNPMPDFLKKTVSIAEHSGNIAFVQTPQFYSNIRVSPIAKGAAMQQAIFFENICEAKGTINAMFCCGTNVLLRASALRNVGGFFEDSVTEDFATSLKFHEQGYRSVYFNHVGVFGMAPESLPAYFKQQARWATGNAGVFRKLLERFFTHPTALSLGQWWEYFVSSTYYFIGFSFLILMLCPILFLLFGIPSYFAKPSIYITTFIPYYLLTLLSFYATMKKRNYDFRNIFIGALMGSINFPVFITSTLKGLLGFRSAFEITPKGKADRLGFWKLTPWTAMIALSLVALAFGYRKFPANPYAIGINMLWCAYHIFILSQVYRLNTLPRLEKSPVIENPNYAEKKKN